MNMQQSRNKQQSVHKFSRRRSGKTAGFARKARTGLRLVLLLFLLFCVWVVYIQWKVQFGPQQALPDKVDVGIVLGAALRKDLPSPGLTERLDHAYALYKEGKFAKLIVTGGLDNNGSKLTEAEGMRNYLVQKGIPDRAILLEPRATSTYENLLYSKQIMDGQGLVTSVVITHNYHGSRALDIATTVGLRNPLVSTTDSEVLFLPYHEGRETFAYMKWEWTKLLLKAGL